MISLLVFSLALSAPSAAVQAPTVTNDPLVMSSQLFLPVQPDTPAEIEEEATGRVDAMEIHPESDICYKIRAFIFSQGAHPRLLRETTCGPKAPAARQLEGAKPELVPLDLKGKPTVPPQK